MESGNGSVLPETRDIKEDTKNSFSTYYDSTDFSRLHNTAIVTGSVSHVPSNHHHANEEEEDEEMEDNSLLKSEPFQYFLIAHSCGDSDSI